MEFYAGDPEVIGQRFTEYDFDTLRELRAAKAYADLSLHLAPEDLDLLTQEVGDTFGAVGPSCESFWRGLGEPIGGNGETYSVAVVSPGWVELMAAVPDSWIGDFAWGWMSAVSDAHQDVHITATEGTVAALRGVVHLCRRAHEEQFPVLFGWYL